MGDRYVSCTSYLLPMFKYLWAVEKNTMSHPTTKFGWFNTTNLVFLPHLICRHRTYLYDFYMCFYVFICILKELTRQPRLEKPTGSYERLAPLGIMGPNWGDPLKPFDTMMLEGFQGVPQFVPHDAKRHASLSEGWIFFPSSRQRSLVRTEKSFRNLSKSNRNQIVFTIFRLIWNSKQTTSVWCSNSIGAW